MDQIPYTWLSRIAWIFAALASLARSSLSLSTGANADWRRSPNNLRPGDALDFWRVEAVEEGRLIRLRAEMKRPGSAWLQFEALPQPAGGTLLVQTAFFEPHGLAGLAYWYGLYPIHQLIFSGMVRAITRRAESYDR